MSLLSFSNTGEDRRRPVMQYGILFLLAAALWIPVLIQLAGDWRETESLSHGPVVFLLSLGLLWMRRDRLTQWEESSTAGVLLLVFSALLHVVAFFADVVFLKSLSLIGMTLGAIGFLGGWQALKVAAGPLGLLVFTIPWPTTLVERLAFPMQLTSSAYAALLSGILGLSIHREGVHLAVMSTSTGKPISSVLVAQQCSGLTSLSVLMALSYLIACYTPVRWGWRALMVAAIVPMALLANTVRLTLVLMAGAYFSPAVAQWVHDHEAPVLVFFCSLGLMGIRQAILAWNGEEAVSKPVPEVNGAVGDAAENRKAVEQGAIFLMEEDGVDPVSVSVP